MSTIQRPTASEEGRRLLEQHNYVDAIDVLSRHLSVLPDGESHALLALAHFHREEYELAAKQYEAALACDPANQDWQEMLRLARGNAVAEIHVPVPDFYYFE